MENRVGTGRVAEMKGFPVIAAEDGAGNPTGAAATPRKFHHPLRHQSEPPRTKIPYAPVIAHRLGQGGHKKIYDQIVR